ncbi:MAG TPA: cytidylate kinase-like family protein [Candidatus Sulfotelmatobacter sp.]|nr:cytidylate kinase-like family protein [Candidatus Sulfotelmatobacter sp.]
MNIETLMEKSGAYVVSERRRQERGIPVRSRLAKPAITISREIGSGALEIANGLAKMLQDTEDSGGKTWEVYDHQLIERALREQHWPKKVAATITEEKRFFIDEAMDDLFRLRPPSWELMPHLIETAMNLAVSGHVILVGHGATIVTAEFPNVFHVRLTSSLRTRIERVQRDRNLTHEDAARLVKREDRKRERFLKAYFHARPDDELRYDLAVNTDRISTADAVSIVFEAAQRFFSKL